MCTILLNFLQVVMVRGWMWNVMPGSYQITCWLTYVAAETWCDIEGDGKREVAGGSVKTGLHVPSMSSHTDSLSAAPLELRLDLLLTLKTHWILNRTHKKLKLLFLRNKTWIGTREKKLTCKQGMSPSEKLNVPMMSSPSLYMVLKMQNFATLPRMLVMLNMSEQINRIKFKSG